MDLKELKKIIDQAGFSEEAREVMDEILDRALERGGITEEEKKKLLDIVDLEAERLNLEADVLEELALAIEGFIVDVSRATDMAVEEMERTEKDFRSALKDLEKEIE
jgi:histone H3/H4